MAKKLAAGSEVDSWCTKCKLDLNHRIIAMDGAKPKRVECLTCRGHHNYRVPKSQQKAKPVRKTTRRSAAATKAALLREEQERRALWEEAIMGRTAPDFTSYKISDIFQLGELVRHKKFGDGVVSELFEGGKMQVLFEAGPKTLVYGR